MADRDAACAGPAGREVVSAQQLQSELSTVPPGDTLRLRDGVYRGSSTIVSVGTPEQPITLCGGRAAVLDGGPSDVGYALHLLGARHWRLVGFSVRGGQTIVGNTGVAAPLDGFQVHAVADGWGRDNLEDNVAGINVTNTGDGSRIACSNSTVGARGRGSDVPCF